MKKHNLHTHTIYSDGENSPEELSRKAIGEGLEIIGISDHGFTRKIRSLNETTLPGYITYLKGIRSRLSGIDIKIGLEIDTLKACGTDPNELPFDILNQLDYVLFEYVRGIDDSEENHGRGLKSIVQARKKLNIPTGLAHTNLHDVFYGKVEEAVKMLGENNIFVEINLKYIPNLEHFFSKQIIEDFKKYGVKVTIGTDYHSKDDLFGEVDHAMKYILERGLKVHEIVC